MTHGDGAHATRTRRLIPRAKKIGLAPGSVVHTGQQHVERVRIDLIRYREAEVETRNDVGVDDACAAVTPERVSWLDVVGLHDTDAIEALGAAFGLHPLTLEDIVSVGQRPKIEIFDGYVYLVLRMLFVEDGRLHSEQVSFVLTDHAVITFQERPGDVFEPVRERLRQGKGRLRKLGADYLAYALLDVVVDHYFTVLESYSDEIEALEDAIFVRPEPRLLARVTALKQETLLLRKAVWPVRELMAALQRDESPLISRTVQTFLRDAYDHVIQAIDTVETLRELLSGLQDAYLSSLSYRMNEVMKVLTVIATIFIPLSFLVGVYGMNFDTMPELHWRWSYPLLWALMLGIVGGMLAYFRRRGWL